MIPAEILTVQPGPPDANTIMVVTGSVVVAILALIGVLAGVFRRNRSEAEPSSSPPAPIPPLAEFTGTPTEYLEIVGRVASDAYRMVGALEAKLEAEKKARERRDGAIARYLQKLFNAWPKDAGKMPGPDPDDLAELEATLPWYQRTRPTST